MTETLRPQVVETTEREFTVAVRSRRRIVLQRFARNRAALIGAVIFVILVLFAFFGGMFWHAGIDPDYRSFEKPSAEHPFGTDQLGRDMLALIIKGTQFSLLIAVVVALLVTVIGVTLGALSGYLGGWQDTVINRVVELMLILPSIVIVGVIAIRFQGSWVMVAVFLGLTTWMTLTRVIRGMVLSLREKEFVEAAKALGASTSRIIFKHIVPNCADVIIVSATLLIAQAVLLEAALSFIGLGVRPPDTSLGLLIYETQNYLPTANAWLFWITLAFIVLVSLSVNFMGDGLRDALDPKQNRVRA